MSLDKLEQSLAGGLAELESRGTLKGRERVCRGVKPGTGEEGTRWFLEGQGEREFLRMNSNSYLGLSLHPDVLAEEEHAVRAYGTGPGGVRFISGTFRPHVGLEKSLAAFHGRGAAMIFSAAYAAVMGVLPPLITSDTVVVSDELNHSCIINAIRLARPAGKALYRHLDMNELDRCLSSHAGRARRALVVTDGIFSMRGDHAPLDRINTLCERYESAFEEGVITVVDDSHGIGAFGRTGRGTEEHTGGRADILVATLGKALGVNGGYVASTPTVVDYLRETSPFYIYSNPVTPAEAAAASKALAVLDGPKGLALLEKCRRLTERFTRGLDRLGYETIIGGHPIVPLMVRDTKKTRALESYLFENNVLATAVTYPVVPEGDEEIRFQVSAGHTEKDIDYVLEVLDDFHQGRRGTHVG